MARPSKAALPEKYTDVSILFLTSGDDAFGAHAEVIEREGEMVISIRDQESVPPYLVRGKRVGHFFAGVDSLQREVHTDVVARWALLGDVYVGIWIEEGIEYLFSFSIPPASNAKA